MKSPPLTLGDMIRDARTARGLSIRQLAPHVGVDYSQLARIESGYTQRPAPEVIHALASVLDLDERTLFSLVGINPPLPDPAAYFHTVFGASASEAAGMLTLLEQHYAHLFPTHQDSDTTRDPQ